MYDNVEPQADAAEEKVVELTADQIAGIIQKSVLRELEDICSILGASKNSTLSAVTQALALRALKTHITAEITDGPDGPGLVIENVPRPESEVLDDVMKGLETLLGGLKASTPPAQGGGI